ncbi:MAG TPA: cytochrome c [Candidatus Acidoferrales bacterium]|nr:cytochrome c [Candidatus Acidoferrales bacterium]
MKSSRKFARFRSLAWLAGVAFLVSGCRLDMHIQPKYLPYEPSSFFADGRSERPMVPGTVARGELRTDTLLFTGMENGVEANRFPFPITKADLERGRERFNVYCTPCHDYTGSGNGMIVQRGFPHPPSFHSDRLRQAPVGHFFGVMTNGFGAMYSYADRVDVGDRWRIAAYIRVLQLSRNATLDDVPEAERSTLAGESTGQTSTGQPAGGQATGHSE